MLPFCGTREPIAVLCSRRHRTLVENHPVNAEAIPHLAKSGRKERLPHRHQSLAAIGKRGEDSFGLFVAIHA